MIDIDQVIDDVTVQMGEDFDPKRDYGILEFCANRAVETFKTYRSYPASFSEEKINSDVEKYYYCIVDLTSFWFQKQGAEFESSHIENNVHRTYRRETDVFLYHGVVRYASLI